MQDPGTGCGAFHGIRRLSRGLWPEGRVDPEIVADRLAERRVPGAGRWQGEHGGSLSREIWGPCGVSRHLLQESLHLLLRCVRRSFGCVLQRLCGDKLRSEFVRLLEAPEPPGCEQRDGDEVCTTRGVPHHGAQLFPVLEQARGRRCACLGHCRVHGLQRGILRPRRGGPAAAGRRQCRRQPSCSRSARRLCGAPLRGPHARGGRRAPAHRERGLRRGQCARNLAHRAPEYSRLGPCRSLGVARLRGPGVQAACGGRQRSAGRDHPAHRPPRGLLPRLRQRRDLEPRLRPGRRADRVLRASGGRRRPREACGAAARRGGPSPRRQRRQDCARRLVRRHSALHDLCRRSACEGQPRPDAAEAGHHGRQPVR
mmetsp:Transcript_17292/g.49483  ORF Transcript_17292/g.49483 Transcript_17292/m.49483 type:complete len:370 (-) Transcript_17292:241-1350(-)